MSTKVVNTKDEYARQIRAVGESLIKNADKIAMDAMFKAPELYIDICINPKDSLPRIEVKQVFYPEQMCGK